MKIAHVLYPYIPEKGYQENNLPHCQADLGHSVKVFTSNTIPSRFQEESSITTVTPGCYDYGSADLIRLPVRRHFKGPGDVLLSGLVGHLRDFSPDIIHMHNLISPRMVQVLHYAIPTQTPFVIDIHIDNGNFNLDTLVKKGGFNMYKILLYPVIRRYANHYLPVNPFAKEFLIEQGFSEENISMIPLGIDTEQFSPDIKAGNIARRELGIGNKEFVILTSGYIEPTKKVENIIEASSRLDGDIVLLIVGEGSAHYMKNLKDILSETTLKYHMTGEVDYDEMAKYYNAADIGIWPGKLGVSILEAIGTGLPVIVSKSPATDFLIQNDNGYSVSQNDKNQLFEIMNEYRTNSKIKEEHSGRSRELATEKLSWEGIAKECVRVYNHSIE